MANKRLSLILDDNRSDRLIYNPTAWLSNNNAAWFNGTSQAATFTGAQRGQPGSVSVTFVGTSISFFGTTPRPPNSQNFSVSIDGGAPFNSSYGDPNPPTYRQWYQSPTVSDGRHVITLSNLANSSFDFATVNAGSSTALTGQTVIVDSDDYSIAYSGQWRRSQDFFNSGPLADGFAFGNATQRSTNIGDSFTFRFSGIAAAIYGVFSWSNIGLIELTISLDGSVVTETFRVNTDTPQFTTEVGDQQNFLFHSYDFLQAGDHTLTVNVTNLVNQTFSFDYVTYIPSFDSLNDMPTLPVGTPSGNPAPTDNAGPGNKKSFPVGAVVGGVVGGLVVIALIVGGIFWWRRRRRLNGITSGSASMKQSEMEIHPFNGVQEITYIPQNQLTTPPPLTSSSFGNNGPLTARESLGTSNDTYHRESRKGHVLLSHSSSTQPLNAGLVPPSPGLSMSVAGASSVSGPTSDSNGSNSDNIEVPPSEGSEPLPPSYVESTNVNGPVRVTYIIQPSNSSSS